VIKNKNLKINNSIIESYQENLDIYNPFTLLDFKEAIQIQLIKEGLTPYAQLFEKYGFGLTADPNVVGYINMETNCIVINYQVSVEAASVLVRHEILHHYLDHLIRGEKWAVARGVNIDKLIHELMNIAMDAEISNRGYTEKDKNIVRNLTINGKHYPGIVTEDNPEWKQAGWDKWAFEEILDELLQEKQLIENLIKHLLNQPQGSKPERPSDKNGEQEGEEREKLADEISKARGNISPNEGMQEAEEIARKSKQIVKELQDNINSIDKEDITTVRDIVKEANKIFSEATKSISDVAKGEDISKKLEDLKDRLNDIKNKAKELIKKNNPNYDPEGDEESRKKELEEINKDKSKILSDLTNADRMRIRKAYEKSEKERNKKEEEELYRRRGGFGGAREFKASLRRFLRRLKAKKSVSSYQKITKKATMPNMIKAGKRRENVENSIPHIAIYFDWSSSWSTRPAKLQAGIDAIAHMKQEYEKFNLVKITVRYFGDDITSTPPPKGSWGNSVGQRMLDEIKEMKFDNVVIFTDNDTSGRYDGSLTQVPGYVWLVFADYVCNDLIKGIQGKKGTSYYMFLESGGKYI